MLWENSYVAVAAVAHQCCIPTLHTKIDQNIHIYIYILINIGLGHLAWDMIWACGPMGPGPGAGEAPPAPMNGPPPRLPGPGLGGRLTDNFLAAVQLMTHGSSATWV